MRRRRPRPTVFLRRCLLAVSLSLATGCGAASATDRPAEGEEAGRPNRMPTAAFTYRLDGLVLAVDASGSSDPDGPIVAYRWSFGDRRTDSGLTASHVYSRPGTYAVTLTVTDEAGAMASTDYIVPPRARNQPPTARFSQNVNGLEVAVDGSGSTDPEGLVVDYDWDFGDGTTATGVRASHVYAKPGSYTVGLTAADDPGATDTATAVVTILGPPPPSSSGSRP